MRGSRPTAPAPVPCQHANFRCRQCCRAPASADTAARFKGPNQPAPCSLMRFPQASQSDHPCTHVYRPWQVSLGLPRKFLSIADTWLSRTLAPRGALVLAGGSLGTSLAAMRAHASQWVWWVTARLHWWGRADPHWPEGCAHHTFTACRLLEEVHAKVGAQACRSQACKSSQHAGTWIAGSTKPCRVCRTTRCDIHTSLLVSWAPPVPLLVHARYRKLFVLLSSYTYVNTLAPLN